MRPRQDVVKGQIALRSAILATELVPQKKIEARECHALLGSYEFFQHHDRRYAELLSLASHDLFVFRDDLDPERGRIAVTFLGVVQ